MWLALITLQQREPEPTLLPGFCLSLLAKVAQGIEAVTNCVSMAVVNLEEGRSFHSFHSLGNEGEAYFTQ